MITRAALHATMSATRVNTMLKALLLAVTIALASAARSFPAGAVGVDARRALLEYEDGTDEGSELGNTNEAVELESHHSEARHFPFYFVFCEQRPRARAPPPATDLRAT